MARAQPCSPYWSLVGGAITGQGYVITFDDGSGPALYATNIHWSGPCGVTVGRWDGHGWTLLDQGLLPAGGMSNLVSLDDGAGPRLYVGGTHCGGGPFPYWWRRWTGQFWEPTPAGMFSTNGTFGPGLSFDDGTGMTIYGLQCPPSTGCLGSWVVRWTGSSWVPVGGPVNVSGDISVMSAVDLGQGMRLFIAGVFSSIGGVAATGIAMWNGAAWQPLGIGIDGRPRALCQYDDGRGPALYVGGNMTTAANTSGNVAVHGLARWDGQSWSDVGGGITSGGLAQINGLATFDDGRGTALYASGYFSQMGGVNANSIARWDGHTWEPLGHGFAGTAESFAVFNDGRGPSLFIAGNYGSAGGSPNGGLTQWVGCPNCYANCDNSTRSPTLNVLDFMCFLNKFAARDPYANCNVDATIDLADFLCFMNKFAVGCP